MLAEYSSILALYLYHSRNMHNLVQIKELLILDTF